MSAPRVDFHTVIDIVSATMNKLKSIQRDYFLGHATLEQFSEERMKIANYKQRLQKIDNDYIVLLHSSGTVKVDGVSVCNKDPDKFILPSHLALAQHGIRDDDLITNFIAYLLLLASLRPIDFITLRYDLPVKEDLVEKYRFPKMLMHKRILMGKGVNKKVKGSIVLTSLDDDKVMYDPLLGTILDKNSNMKDYQDKLQNIYNKVSDQQMPVLSFTSSLLYLPRRRAIHILSQFSNKALALLKRDELASLESKSIVTNDSQLTDKFIKKWQKAVDKLLSANKKYSIIAAEYQKTIALDKQKSDNLFKDSDDISQKVHELTTINLNKAPEKYILLVQELDVINAKIDFMQSRLIEHTQKPPVAVEVKKSPVPAEESFEELAPFIKQVKQAHGQFCRTHHRLFKLSQTTGVNLDNYFNSNTGVEFDEMKVYSKAIKLPKEKLTRETFKEYKRSITKAKKKIESYMADEALQCSQLSQQAKNVARITISPLQFWQAQLPCIAEEYEASKQGKGFSYFS